MKELTIEEKAQAYDETIKRAKELLEIGLKDTRDKRVVLSFFPELKESEDERIRKEIISALKMANHKGVYDKHIAWLENQKEFVSADFDDVWETADCDELTAPLEKYSKDAIKEMCHAWYDKGIELERKSWLEKQGEQKETLCDKCKKEYPYNSCQDITALGRCALEGLCTTKQEPKFQKGKWIVWQNQCYKVNYNGCGYELILQNGLTTSLEYGIVDKSARLWTIQDAKDGDVLASELCDSIILFRGIKDNNIDFYCYYDFSKIDVPGDRFAINNGEHYGSVKDSKDIHPVTKEQRDTLMKAMANAGYTFDFEKKELKKIAQKPAEWSEEDEETLEWLCRFLEKFGNEFYGGNEVNVIFWLKSLKDKVQPKQELDGAEIAPPIDSDVCG